MTARGEREARGLKAIASILEHSRLRAVLGAPDGSSSGVDMAVALDALVPLYAMRLLQNILTQDIFEFLPL